MRLLDFFKNMGKKQLSYVDVNAGLYNRAWGQSVRMDFKMLHYLYKNIAEVQAGVRRISNAMLREGFNDSVLFYRNGEKVEDQVTMGVLNLFEDPQKFIKRFVKDSVCYGNVYINKIKNPNGEIVSLQFIDPRTMYIVANEFGEVQKYIQKVNMHNPLDFEPDDIIHIVADESLDNPLLGMSPLEVLLFDGYAEIQAAKTNKAFYENAGTPSHLLIVKKPISLEQANQIQDSMKKHFGGADNKYKSGLIPYVEDIKTVAPTQKEMEYLATRTFNARKVSVALGVDMFLLGYTEGVQRSNGQIIEKDFYENTVRPYEFLLANVLQNIAQETDNSLIVKVKETDHYNALINKQQAREDFRAGIITLNEAREVSGHEPSFNELADEHFINGFLIDDLAEELKNIRQTAEIRQIKESQQCKNLLEI